MIRSISNALPMFPTKVNSTFEIAPAELIAISAREAYLGLFAEMTWNTAMRICPIFPPIETLRRSIDFLVFFLGGFFFIFWHQPHSHFRGMPLDSPPRAPFLLISKSLDPFIKLTFSHFMYIRFFAWLFF